MSVKVNSVPEAELLGTHDKLGLLNQQIDQLFTYLQQHSKFYQKRFEELSLVKPSGFSLADLKLLPLTTKDQLNELNEDFLCVEKNKISDFVTTSGTTGTPVVFYLTENDINRLAYNEALSMLCIEASSNDVFLLTTTIDKRFMAGLAYVEGVRKLGAGIIRNGPGSPQFQWDAILKFKPTVIIGIPSFIPKLIAFAQKNGIDLAASSVKKIICIGEPIRNADFSLNKLGELIKSQWNVELFSSYASTEKSTAYSECQHHNGGHEHPELIYTEVLDQYGNEVAEGALGEVVVTTFGVEAMPLVRYKTGDICRVYHEICACGRTSKRLGPIEGRNSQMIKLNGTTVYAQSIFNVLEEYDLNLAYLVELKASEYGTDEVCILLQEGKNTQEEIAKLQSIFKTKLRVKPQFRFMEKKEFLSLRFPADSRKPIKWIDLRS